MATRTISNAGGNWNDTASWVENAVPTNADDVIPSATSGNLTINITTASCRSIDLDQGSNLYSGKTLTQNVSCTLAVGGSTAPPSGIALRFAAGMTYTLGNAVNSGLSFPTSHTTQQTIDFAGKTCGGITFSGSSGVAPSWKFLSDSTNSTAASVNHQRGTIDTNGYTMNWGAYTSSTDFGTTRILTLGSSTINLTGGNGTIWNVVPGATHTVNAGTSVINITSTANNPKTFIGGGRIYNTIQVATGAAAGTTTFSDSFTVAKFGNTGSSVKTVVFTAGTTITLTGGTDAFFSGIAGNLITIQSSSTSSAATLSKAGGLIKSDYISLRDSNATGGAIWYAGANSTNVANNPGWQFRLPQQKNFFPFFT